MIPDSRLITIVFGSPNILEGILPHGQCMSGAARIYSHQNNCLGPSQGRASRFVTLYCVLYNFGEILQLLLGRGNIADLYIRLQSFVLVYIYRFITGYALCCPLLCNVDLLFRSMLLHLHFSLRRWCHTVKRDPVLSQIFIKSQ